MTDDQLRISDAERELAAAELAEHYAQGRLTTDEHTERLDRIWAARTRSDLAPVFRDLPGGAYGPASSVASPRSVERGYWAGGPRLWAGRRGVPAPLLVVLVVLVAVSAATHVPVFLAGILVLVFVMGRHRRRAMWSRPGRR